jgi:hypothetical protein
LRRSICAAALALAAGILSVLSPVANVATAAPASTPPRAPGEFGVRLVDVPVFEAANPRALDYLVDYLSTGTVIRRRILMMNGEPRTVRFSVYPDAAFISGGQFNGYPGATRSELTSWIKVRYRTVTVPAGKTASDLITIRVPHGATRGEHYGLVWVQQTAKARHGNRRGIGVTEVSRVGIRVYLAVGRGGAPPTSFDITSITGRRTPAGQLLVVAHVSNTGGRALDLNGTVRLADGPGGTSAGPFPVQKIVTIAPGQSWDMVFVVPHTLPAGSWRATVRLASGLTRATGAATVMLAPAAAAQAALSGVPWPWLALIVILLALTAAMGRFWWQHRRGQAPA